MWLCDLRLPAESMLFEMLGQHGLHCMHVPPNSHKTPLPRRHSALGSEGVRDSRKVIRPSQSHLAAVLPGQGDRLSALQAGS